MRTVQYPAFDEIALYDQLQSRRQAKTALRLKSARAVVARVYRSYADGDVHSRTTTVSNRTTAKALISNYTALRYGALRDEGLSVLSRSTTCCLCGIRPSSELDHYLPKLLFPEFAVLTMNLVPVCGPCNAAKGEEYVVAGGAQRFVHAYLDAFPADESFLSVDLDAGASAVPLFSLKQAGGLSLDLFQVLKGQFEKFDLGRIYSEQATELLSEARESIEEYHVEGGQAAVSRYLDREARSVRRVQGVNHWKTAVLFAAARSFAFCAGRFKTLA